MRKAWEETTNKGIELDIYIVWTEQRKIVYPRRSRSRNVHSRTFCKIVMHHEKGNQIIHKQKQGLEVSKQNGWLQLKGAPSCSSANCAVGTVVELRTMIYGHIWHITNQDVLAAIISLAVSAAQNIQTLPTVCNIDMNQPLMSSLVVLNKLDLWPLTKHS